MTKTCSKCKETKHFSEFYKRKTGKDWVSSWCKVCVKLDCRKRYDKTSSATDWIKRKYGLSAEDFNRLVELQGNSCNICFVKFINTPHVDHCHKTNKVRGLLCSACNKGLGFFKENPIHLANAIKYLHDTKTETPYEQIRT